MNMSVLATALLVLAAILPGNGSTPLIGGSEVAVVTDTTCPVMIEQVTLDRTAKGIVVSFSVRNTSRDPIKTIVLTAAGVDWTGAVAHIQAVPVAKRISGGARARQRAEFTSAELSRSEGIVIGVQAVQWNGNRVEWRGALKLNAPVAVASR